MIDGHSILSRRGPQNLLGSCVFVFCTFRYFSSIQFSICLAYLDRLASFLFLSSEASEMNAIRHTGHEGHE
jgi:hypothetical protein